MKKHILFSLIMVLAVSGQAIHAADFNPQREYEDAIADHRVDQVKRLILMSGDFKVDLGAKDQSGDTLLMKAISYVRNTEGDDRDNAVEIVIIFIEKADESIVNSSNKRGGTALHRAADIGSKDIMLALLDKDADIDAQNIGGETPLMTAVRNGQVAAARYLIEIEDGADTDITNKQGKTALKIAEDLKARRILNLFKLRKVRR